MQQPLSATDNSYDYPEDSVIIAQGSWDDHYLHMKNYWNERLKPLAEITKLPDENLINAYKAGYIYTLIIADGTELHVGENGYDQMFDHDSIGIISTLVTVGDYTNVKQYLTHILDNIQYPDARWKYSWPYALYLEKTGDSAYIESMFDTIKTNTHYIETDRTGDGGIMKPTYAIDSKGYWLIDDWAALHGLTTYKYICDYLYAETSEAQYKTESDWASQQYTELLAATENKQAEMRENYNYPYLSIDMNVPTELSARSDARDANWASMFLFGRWAWDGYLFGADQTNSEMISLIDDTYTHGFDRRSDITDTIYNFGGYPHGYFSSAYNAGYGSAALRGEEYRDAGIKAYEFMINESMSGPYGWWEGVGYPSDSSPWDIDHAAGGGGSCQHMWGQSTATKVLFDSLIAAKADGTAIIGRGIPEEWITDGQQIEVKNYPVNDGARMGFNITTEGKTVTLTLTGDNSETPVSLELLAFKNNIASAGDFAYDNTTGVVTVPAGTKTVTVELKSTTEETAEHGNAVKSANQAVESADAVDGSLYTTSTVKAMTDAVANVNNLLADDSATTEALNAAAKAVTDAINGLVPLSVGEIGLDYTGGYQNTYIFGQDSDQIRRYQTFKTGDVAGQIGYIDVPLSKVSADCTYGDVVATLYTLEDDHKTLKDAIGETRIAAADFKTGANNRLCFENVTLDPNTYYALVLGQDRTNITGDPLYTWDTGDSKGDDLYFIKDTGNGNYTDESWLGTGMMTIFFEEFNKKDLDTAVSDAEKLSQPGYTADSWANFTAQLTSAKEVLNNPAATKADYETAKTNLAEAKAALKEGPIADTEALNTIVQKIETLKSDDYSADSWARLQTALTNAKEVLADLSAEQSVVNAAFNQLAEAYTNLENKTVINKTELAVLIDVAKSINTEGYPSDMVTALQSALTEAEKVYEDANATSQQVDNAAEALKTAVNDLLNTSSNDNDATTSETPTDSSESTISTVPANSPQTGESVNVIPILLLVLSGVFLVVLASSAIIKRKNKIYD